MEDTHIKNALHGYNAHTLAKEMNKMLPTAVCGLYIIPIKINGIKRFEFLVRAIDKRKCFNVLLISLCRNGELDKVCYETIKYTLHEAAIAILEQNNKLQNGKTQVQP